jgi:hypothetical protein
VSGYRIVCGTLAAASSSGQNVACSDHVGVTNMGEVSMGGYLLHINRLLLVCGLCTGCSLEHNGLRNARDGCYCPTGA